MMIHSTLAARRRFYNLLPRLAVMILSLVLVAGCASNGMTRIQTWEGPRAQGEDVAVLKAPGAVKVLQVNGREVGNFLMDDLALDYELLPGENTVAFIYKTIWARSGVVRDGESKVHVVQTAPQQVTIDARAGEVYHFDLPEVETRQEAETLLADFSARVVNQAGRAVASVRPYGDEASASLPPLPGSAATEKKTHGSDAEPAGTAVSPDTLDALKQLWGEASGEEKRAFLRWAFD